MSARDEYLLRAAHLLAKAEAQPDAALKDELENMARSYLRLAEQAKRNDDTDIVYETPPPKDRDQHKRTNGPMPCKRQLIRMGSAPRP
jgi:hypothetical protein